MITAPPPRHLRPHSGAMCIIVRCNAHIMVYSVCFCRFFHTHKYNYTQYMKQTTHKHGGSDHAVQNGSGWREMIGGSMRKNFFHARGSTHTGWSYSSGFVGADMISAHLPTPGPHSQILMCGPPPMIKFETSRNWALVVYRIRALLFCAAEICACAYFAEFVLHRHNNGFSPSRGSWCV